MPPATNNPPYQCRALFLDRDGVINVDYGYVHLKEEFHFLPGIFDFCKFVHDRGFKIVVVTNQAGIGRGFYTTEDFENLTSWMVRRFSEEGIVISAVYHCPYHPEAGIGPYKQESSDRKPNPGMILRAKEDLSIDLANSVLVGDKESDIEAAFRAGIGTSIRFGALEEGEGTKADFHATDYPSVIRILSTAPSLEATGL